MALFSNPHKSHLHSLEILNLLYEYDTFLDNLQVIADMGCGGGLDAKWWADLTTRDDSPQKHNYIVYAVDQNISQVEPDVAETKNVIMIEGNFEEKLIPRSVDLIWAHDSLQYSQDPFKCLATWKNTMTTNGMLVLSIPQTTYLDSATGRLVVRNHNHQYFSYNLLTLTYMLAVSGFDCRDAYFYREAGTPWLYAAVYASEQQPLSRQTTWYELAEQNLINDSLIESVNTYGYARLEDIRVTWLDKNIYFIND